MEIIRNTNLLKEYMKQFKINDYFDTPNLQFNLLQYNKGEIIIRPSESFDYILFVVDGRIKIYAIQSDGTQNAVNMVSGFIVLGEMEFLTNYTPIFFVEAMTNIVCISVSIRNHKSELMTDARFLKLLATGLAEKFQLITQQETIRTNLEAKLINYIEFHCHNHVIEHMEHTAFQLHCSRRQLQRVIKKLCDSGVLIKTGKGKYRLADAYIKAIE